MGRRLGITLASLLVLLFISCDDLALKLEEQILKSQGLTEYTLTLIAETGGNVSPEMTTLKSEESYNIIATADSGYTFIKWTKVGGSGTYNIDNLTSNDANVEIADGDITLQAEFTTTPRELSVLAGSGGSISQPAASPINVDDGDPSNIEAVPNTGYVFDGWTKTGGSGTASFTNNSNASTSVTVSGGDAEVTASFILATYTLAVESSDTDDGTISNPGSGSATVIHGSARSISTTNPTTRGKYFSGWSKVSGSGTVVFGNASNRSTTATVTGGDVTIRANYSDITASLSTIKTFDLDLSVNSTSERLETVNDIVVVGDYAYVGGQSPAGGAQILKIDISDKSSPSFYDNWNPGTGSVEDLNMTGSIMSVGVSSSSSAIADLYTFTPTSNFTPVDRGFNESIMRVGGGYYVADESDSMRFYYSYADWEDLDEISSVTYDSNYGRAYVTGYSDMGAGELHSLNHNNGTDTFDDAVPPFLIQSYNASWDYYFYDVLINDVYLYIAMDKGGILTMFIDDDPLTVSDRDARSASSGNPRFLEFGGGNENYLIALSYEYSNINDGRLAVYDIHGNNGSYNEPLLLDSRGTAYNTQPKALATLDDYVYTIEGTYMVIYKLNTSTD